MREPSDAAKRIADMALRKYLNRPPTVEQINQEARWVDAELQAEREAAERIFKVTTHARDCHATIPGQKCTCGLNGLIAAYEKATGKKGT